MFNQELHERLQYEPGTGFFYWIDKTTRLKRKRAGYTRFDHYVRICFKGKYYQAHRLAWFMTYGKWPEMEIDHIDRDRTNNRIDNLRDVNRQTNNQNKTNRADKVINMKGKTWILNNQNQYC